MQSVQSVQSVRSVRSVQLRRVPVWVAPTLLALVLGAVELGRPELWRDELASWSAAVRDLGQLWGLLGNVDAVSGLYYAFLHFWVQAFGASAASLRLPSVLATGATAGLTAVVGRRLFDSTRVGLWAGLLYAVTPTVIRYAQEARVYALVDTAVLLATWQLLRILDCREPNLGETAGPRRMALRWLGYSALLVLTGLLHLVALSVVPAHLWLLYVRRRRAWRGFVPAVALAGLLLVPLLVAGNAQAGRQISWIPRPNGFAFPGMLQALTSSWAETVLLLALSAFACLQRQGLRYLPVPIIPVLVVWAISQTSTSYWEERYLLFVLPLWTILAARGAERLPQARWTAPAAVALIAVIAFPAQQSMRTLLSHTSTDWKAAAQVITAGYRPGDAFVPERGVSAKYMLDLGVDYYLPSRVRLHDMFVARTAAQSNDLLAQECAVPSSCLNGAARVWVVSFGHLGNPLSRLPQGQRQALAGAYRVERIRYVTGMTVALLTLKG